MEARLDERGYHGPGSATRVVEQAGGLMTTKTLEQARNDADPRTEADYILWLSSHRKVGDIFKFKTRKGEAYILSW
ncbi:MAG: hypothetical protein JO247_13900 [Chloroflexi bacterium]|nr:hypothetical protein [Chloroflexota bacterium]